MAYDDFAADPAHRHRAWYRDPQPGGEGQQRWWDGEQWTDQTRPRPGGHRPPTEVSSPAPKSSSSRKWILVGCAVLVLAIAGAIGGYVASRETDEDKAAATCQDAVRDRLKDPDSAQFRDVTTERSDKGWSVEGEVNAANSYGGMDEYEWFTCTVPGPDFDSTMAFFRSDFAGGGQLR